MNARTVPSAIASIATICVLVPGPARTDEDPLYDWGVAYYMSYDNDLAAWGQPIIENIRRGVGSERTVAAVQADFTDEEGMRRYVITSKGMEEMRLASEDSADEAQVIEYLDWFVRMYPSKRYVITFLNHGGRLDDMCRDDRPGPSGKSWMSGRILGEQLRALKARMSGKWSLLFLQQCGRGSLENLYSFRGTADFILTSPLPVGAPNTYYTALHRWLAGSPEASGAAVAVKIAEEDRDYSLYSGLRTASLEELPKRLDAALAPILALEAPVAPERPSPIHNADEPIVDAASYLGRLADVNNAGRPEFDAFITWARTELLTFMKFRQNRMLWEGRLCGLSLFAAGTPEEARRYQALELYEASKLGALWDKLVGSLDSTPSRGEREPRGNDR